MELQRIESEDSFEKKAHAFNIKSKSAARIFGNNLSLIICLFLPVLFILCTWTKPTLSAGLSVAGDFAMTIVIFLTGQRAALNVGVEGGKLDDEYIDARKRYREEREKVLKVGITALPDYCLKEVQDEYENAVNSRCVRFKISRAELDAALAMTSEEVTATRGKVFSMKVDSIRKLEPIELTDDMLLTDGREQQQRGGLGKGADEHLAERWKGKKGIAHIAVSCLTVVFSVAVTFAVTDKVSVALVVYTLYKIAILLARMANSYRAGAKAYNTYEVEYLNNKTKYLIKYQEYLRAGKVDGQTEKAVETLPKASAA